MDVVAEVDDEQIAEVLANWTGIPVFKLTEEETTRLLRMEDELHKRIIGQEEAIKSVSQAIRRTRAGLKDPRRPGGSFIFAGPSGVGKTELAKALAQFLFGEDDALIQIDMGEFHDRFTVSRLVGAPPGYVGYDEGGQLTEKVRRKPFSVVLFDEIEKAHADVFNTLLQVLEDGRLTDGQGRIVDFKNTILILTTNLGTRDISKAVGLGFQVGNDTASNYERMKNKVNEELKQHFRPEFLNRIDDIVVFHQLTEDEIIEIVDLMVARVETQLANKDMALEITPAAKKLLAHRGFDPVLGARPLRRTIQREIEDALSEKILYGELTAGQIIVVDVDEAEGAAQKFTFRGEAKPVDLPDTPPVALSGAEGGADEEGPAAKKSEADHPLRTTEAAPTARWGRPLSACGCAVLAEPGPPGGWLEAWPWWRPPDADPGLRRPADRRGDAGRHLGVAGRPAGLAPGRAARPGARRGARGLADDLPRSQPLPPPPAAPE